MENPVGDTPGTVELTYAERVSAMQAAWETGNGFSEEAARKLARELQDLRGTLLYADGDTEGIGKMIGLVSFMAGDEGTIVLGQE